MGTLVLTATYTDDNPAGVMWAVREGTCAAATNTRAGNVDGFNTAYLWIGTVPNKTFSATINVSTWTTGDYCFVFNPGESSLERDIRLTRLFSIIQPDSDGDGVDNIDDLCSGTVADQAWDSDKGWGINRWQVQSDFWWYQNKPAGKGTYNPTITYDIGYTYGCDGHQILALLGDAMKGHYKFGISSSVLEEFHLDMSDGILDGRYLVETVTVPANKATDTLSVNPLLLGTNYVLKAYGTADAGDTITFDARYSFRTLSSSSWTDAVSTYEGYGVTLLDLLFNGTTPWGAFDLGHNYEYAVAGDGNNATFRIYDVYYPNNTGNLSVDILVDL